jgi:TRAP-type C4-dicarboxylate transport system permease small subunit
MPEEVSDQGSDRDPLGYWLEKVCGWFAVAGGIVLAAMTGMSTLSIAGRAVFGKPIQGDFELIQLGCAACVAAFLPYCQLRRANIIVDFFTTRASKRTQTWLDIFGALLLVAVMALLAWRTAVGTISVKEAGETSMIMGFPLWISYAFMVPGFALCALVGLHTAYGDWRGLGR